MELQDIISSTVEGTSKHLKQLLTGIYDNAIRSNIVNSNLAKLLKTSKIKAYVRKTNVFDRSTIFKIKEYSNNTDNLRLKKIADMTLILLYSGMRSGEIRTIEKKNIFLDKNYMIGGIKTDARKIELYLFTLILNLLLNNI